MTGHPGVETQSPSADMLEHVLGPSSSRPQPLICAFCGREDGLLYRQVIGWIKYRKAGGPNQIEAAEETGHFACAACVLAEKGRLKAAQ